MSARRKGKPRKEAPRLKTGHGYQPARVRRSPQMVCAMKRAYRSEKDARKRAPRYLAPYQCVICGMWHLTTQRG